MPQDRFAVRTVVIALAIIAAGAVAGLLYCVAAVDLSPEQKNSALTAIISIGTASLGAIAGILAKTSSGDPAPYGPPAIEAAVAAAIPEAPAPPDAPAIATPGDFGGEPVA